MNKTIFESKGEELVVQSGMSKAEFARRVGIQRQNVKSLFKSHNLRTIQKVSEVLGVEVAYLISYVEPLDFSCPPFDVPLDTMLDSHENNDESFVILPEEIPTGDSTDDRRCRQRIIFKYYQQWKSSHPDQSLYNLDLKELINIRAISIEETAAHASLHYLSTLAVFQLDAILTNAKKVAARPSKAQTKNQRQFESMLLMEYDCVGIGKVKLTVGVKRTDKSKVQYCITALEDERLDNKTKQPR